MKCPQCGAEMEQGYVNAPMTGIAWLPNPSIRWLWSRGVELFQRDWFGPAPFKAALSAERCRNCWLVCFWHYQRNLPVPASPATDKNPPKSRLRILILLSMVALALLYFGLKVTGIVEW